MAPVSEHVEVERRPKLGGGGPGKIPHRRGYGGGDDGDRGPRDPSSKKERLRRYWVGMMLCIISVTTLFLCLSLVYIFRQGAAKWDPGLKQFVRDWRPLVLPYTQLWINTAILLCSSITLELARRRMAKQAEFAALGILPYRNKTDVPWLGLTVLLGFAFLAGQLMVWNSFQQQGLFLKSNPSGSLFVILTGMHALHLTGGLIALLYAATGNWMRVRFESQQLAVTVTAWYWHFMGALWIYLFGLLHFARG